MIKIFSRTSVLHWQTCYFVLVNIYKTDGKHIEKQVSGDKYYLKIILTNTKHFLIILNLKNDFFL